MKTDRKDYVISGLLKRAGIEDVEHVADGGVPMLSKEVSNWSREPRGGRRRRG